MFKKVKKYCEKHDIIMNFEQSETASRIMKDGKNYFTEMTKKLKGLDKEKNAPQKSKRDKDDNHYFIGKKTNDNKKSGYKGKNLDGRINKPKINAPSYKS